MRPFDVGGRPQYGQSWGVLPCRIRLKSQLSDMHYASCFREKGYSIDRYRKDGRRVAWLEPAVKVPNRIISSRLPRDTFDVLGSLADLPEKPLQRKTQLKRLLT
jgi:hypothetical protein